MSEINKAILVIDMPETCGDCLLCVGDEYDLVHECCLKYKGYVGAKDKPEWCPLKTSLADVAPVIHARWIDNGRGGYAHAYFCSNCGWLDGYPIEDRFNYCPNCGAKMDESEDEE